MKKIILTSLLLWVSAAAHADYSRLYFDHMPAATTQSGDTDIAYRIFNRGSENPKLLLIMGLGGAGAAWGDAFLQALEFEGFEVIVIDNRDTGSSAMFTEWGKPTLWWQLLKYELGFSVDSPYDLNDMAADSIAVSSCERMCLARTLARTVGRTAPGLSPSLALAMALMVPRRGRSQLVVHSSRDELELALYEDANGTLVLFVVHGGVGTTAFEATVCAPQGNVTVSRQDIGSWLVSVASVGEGGASWWKW